MTRIQFITHLALGLLLFCSACKTIESTEEFNRWLNNPKNGCVSSKRVAGIELTIKYQPSNYLLLKELDAQELNNKSLSGAASLARNDSIITFLMTLAPDKPAEDKSPGSVMYHGVKSMPEYSDRVLTTNFFMDQHIRLYVDGNEYLPLMAIMDNVYELSDKRQFIVVFSADDILFKGREYLFVYQDPFFQMGDVQLSFDGKKLENARNVAVRL